MTIEMAIAGCTKIQAVAMGLAVGLVVGLAVGSQRVWLCGGHVEHHPYMTSGE